MRITKKKRLNPGGFTSVESILMVAIAMVLVVGGFVIYKNNKTSTVVNAGSNNWTPMGTVSAVELHDGDGVSLQLKACSDNPNTDVWVIEGQAVLSSAPSVPTNFYANMYDYSGTNESGSVLEENGTNIWTGGTTGTTSFVIGLKNDSYISFSGRYFNPTTKTFTSSWATGHAELVSKLVNCS